MEIKLKLQCESKNPPPEIFWHFSPSGWEFLVQILYIPIYAGVHIFIQFPATVTKLCHIKCDDHDNVLKMSTINRNTRWVVALNFVTAADNWTKICILA